MACAVEVMWTGVARAKLLRRIWASAMPENHDITSTFLAIGAFDRGASTILIWNLSGFGVTQLHKSKEIRVHPDPPKIWCLGLLGGLAWEHGAAGLRAPRRRRSSFGPTGALEAWSVVSAGRVPRVRLGSVVVRVDGHSV